MKQSENSLTIVTITLQNPEPQPPGRAFNERRTEILRKVLNSLKACDVLLLPAGFYTLDEVTDKTIDETAEIVKKALADANSDAVVCFGIDSTPFETTSKKSGEQIKINWDQLALAVNRAEIIGIGRKFNPVGDEKGNIEKADGYNSFAFGKERIFEKKGKRLYMAVCFDVFALRKKKKPNIQAVLTLAHCFHKPGEGHSSDSRFARCGFLGTSWEWELPVFGTATFYNRNVPENWPTGVIWSDNGEKVKDCRYIKYENNCLEGQRLPNIEGLGEKPEKAVCYSYCI